MAGTDRIRSHRKRGARVGWGKVLSQTHTAIQEIEKEDSSIGLRKPVLWFCGKVIAESDVNTGKGRVLSQT